MMKVVILLAGRGTRMRPLTRYLNKGMVPVAGRPILEHILLKLKRQGFDDFLIAVTMFPRQLQNYFGNGDRWDVHIEYLDRPNPSQTAGEVAACAEKLADREHFVVHYGDVISNLDTAAMARRHIESGAAATLGLVNGVRYHGGVATLDENGMVSDFTEKPATAFPTHAAINVFSRRVLDYCKAGKDFGHDVIPAMIAAGEPVAGFLDADAYWFDVGRISDLDTVNDFLGEAGAEQ